MLWAVAAECFVTEVLEHAWTKTQMSGWTKMQWTDLEKWKNLIIMIINIYKRNGRSLNCFMEEIIC